MAPQKESEAVSGLLRQSLADDRGAGVCPEPEILAAYFEHALDPDESALCDTHFSRCARCREQLAGMARAEQGPKPQPRRLWLVDWRLVSALTAAMVLLTVWAIRRPEKLAQITPAPKPPAVATTKPEAALPEANLEAKNELKQAPPPEMYRAVPRSSVAPAKPIAGLAKDRERDEAESTRKLQLDQTAQNQNGAGSAGALVQSRAAGHDAGNAQNVQQVQSLAPSAKTMNAQANLQPAQPAQFGSGIPVAGSSPPISGGTIQAKESSRQNAAAPPPLPTADAQAQAVTGAAATEVTPAAEPSSENKKKQTSLPVVSDFAADRVAMLQTLEERSAEKIISTPIASVQWRISGGGFIERSEDGGATWHGQEPYAGAHLLGGSAPSARICWLVGRGGLVVVTRDATNWKRLPPPAPVDLIAVSAKSASSATVIAADGRRFATHDEGKKWKPEN
ncbi:MAG TPA: hypothetical protein VLY23_05305 [Candidatus Acidoferrum sp.]|nr:hypothetical protein [Candidatus Acidoferrum sp.]